jgi:hypothetical protein
MVSFTDMFVQETSVVEIYANWRSAEKIEEIKN